MDEAFDPIRVSLLRADAVMPQQNGLPHLLQKAWRVEGSLVVERLLRGKESGVAHECEASGKPAAHYGY